MSKAICGRVMVTLGFVWAISGNIEIAYTCWCTALILFNIEK